MDYPAEDLTLQTKTSLKTRLQSSLCCFFYQMYQVDSYPGLFPFFTVSLISLILTANSAMNNRIQDETETVFFSTTSENGSLCSVLISPSKKCQNIFYVLRGSKTSQQDYFLIFQVILSTDGWGGTNQVIRTSEEECRCLRKNNYRRETKWRQIQWIWRGIRHMTDTKKFSCASSEPGTSASD